MGICFQDDKPKVKPIVLKPEEQAILDCKKCRDKIKNYIAFNRYLKHHNENYYYFLIHFYREKNAVNFKINN